MLKIVISLALVACCLHLAEGGQTCSKMSALTSCYKDVHRLMQRPINLTNIIWAAGGIEQSVASRCAKFKNLTNCVENQMRGCSSVSDSNNDIVQFWDNGRNVVHYLCDEHLADFTKHQSCMSADATRNAANKCDTQESDAKRRRRHTCDDYNKEILCADREITKFCGEEAARHVGFLTRTLLKNTPHTRNCNAPEFSASTSGSISVMSIPALLGACMLMVIALM